MIRKTEVREKERFAFGKNWRSFLINLNDAMLIEAEKSLKSLLECQNLTGKTFLDVGCGSGLFSLAARRLGASVRSFDFDKESVACTNELKKKYFPEDTMWIIEQGDVLDVEYLSGLGTFDVVYAWGVLHHTGNMWRAFETIVPLVKNCGKLCLAIYNDQGRASRLWRVIKRMYVRSGTLGRVLIISLAFLRLRFPSSLRDFFSGHPMKTWRAYVSNRGMSSWYDLIDWVGGYPFEVAKPEEVFNFFKQRGFVLEKLKTCGGGHGCNEFVFVKQVC